MSKTSKQQNHQADIRNGNWGTPGTNSTWDRAQGNRGTQMNPNQQQPTREPGGGPQGTRKK